ncbi:hypothetical protein KKE60_07600 [Patescibacteria group bacterium]|nr:hypothetical protein [Patescibacteria group bacterium]
MNLIEKIDRLGASTRRLFRIAKTKDSHLHLSDEGQIETWYYTLRREAWINLKRSLAVFWAALRERKGE